MKQSWAYILLCSDGSYYVGCTTDLQRRIAQHDSGVFGGYTSKRRPVRLVWSQEFSDIHDAVETERRIKKWTRAKKEALISSDFELLHQWSRSTAAKRRSLKLTSTP
jgi:predicted GIY-YIG superfamily endonuclease